MDAVAVAELASEIEILEAKFFSLCRELKIEPPNIKAMEVFLAPLKYKSPITSYHYGHSLRVGMLAVKIARFIHMEERAIFYAGILHDIGKCQVPLNILGKNGTLTEPEFKEIERHVIEGYRMLRGRFDFSAEIILWHHRFQLRRYPKKMPPKLHAYSLATQLLIEQAGRVLALADVFDALHRTNERYGPRPLTSEQIKTKMLELNPDRRTLILALYEAGIFE